MSKRWKKWHWGFINTDHKSLRLRQKIPSRHPPPHLLLRFRVLVSFVLLGMIVVTSVASIASASSSKSDPDALRGIRITGDLAHSFDALAWSLSSSWFSCVNLPADHNWLAAFAFVSRQVNPFSWRKLCAQGYRKCQRKISLLERRRCRFSSRFSSLNTLADISGLALEQS